MPKKYDQSSSMISINLIKNVNSHEFRPPFSEEGQQRSQMADMFFVRHEHRSYLQKNDDTIS
ncbi:UNVERIFIED_CONTAM: hypothetical protein NCL1_37966 [Trichonephila clavipes]